MNFKGELVRVIDGDTYDLRVDVRHFDPERPIWLPRIRCAHYDAPELHKPNGKEARDALIWKLLQVDWLEIETIGRDSFRRLVAETYIAGEKLSDWAVTSGFGRLVAVEMQLSR